MNQLTNTTGEHPADGSPTFAVRGPAGAIEYDVLGNHVRVIDDSGEVIDAMGKAFYTRMREYVDLGDNDAVFAALTDLYRTDLEGGAR